MLLQFSCPHLPGFAHCGISSHLFFGDKPPQHVCRCVVGGTGKSWAMGTALREVRLQLTVFCAFC